MTMIKGIAASNGIAIAKAYKLVMPDLTVEKVTVEDVEKEIKAYENAMEQTAKDLETIKLRSKKRCSASFSVNVPATCCSHIFPANRRNSKNQ